MENLEDLDSARGWFMLGVTQNRRLTSENRPTNCPAEEAAGEDRTPGEHRQDGGYENNQQQHPASITINGRDLKEVTSFTHLSSIEHCLNYRQVERTRMSNRARIGKARNTHIHQPEINLENQSSSLSQHQQQNSVGFSIQTWSSQSVLLYG
uniref:Uncharacterized protein n=1 Tax=Trichobilharzia regenti TaxID=157069 RepID=A0AA85IWL0_TRIRE|nr:unnamed protein product [Trichobilharzia regenti]